ncbi:polysaccharide pyruvyl transferase family protein [Oceanitalea stevensii]|uniref:Polysaccharide pyruvyl transferase family protein n=1 Tax=Oceanitalea stevensii TaxID=2763072 RepID=A0ABR8Z4Z8_9MICO|nr:polysaccharide pyruvyl transferase family protein [Oceanitalea stevensii]MBD8063395.1 polysaccharide pyruvyl transferase family protein [Oceanitalea stevensii]
MSNFGDDLFRATIVARGSDLWPSARVRTSAPRDRSTISGRVYQSASKVGAVLRLAYAVRDFRWADDIVLGGGSVFQSVKGRHVMEAWLARHRLRRLSALGVSFGPFSTATDEREVSDFARAFERIVVRDRPSMEFAELWGIENKVKFGGDLAALYPFETELSTQSDGLIRIGIMPCEYKGLDRGAYLDGISAFLAALKDIHGARLRVTSIALNYHPTNGDLDLAKEVARTARTHTDEVQLHSYSGDLAETLGVIRRQSFNVATRLHGGVVSYLTETPFAQVNYHPKCADFMDDIGAPEAAAVSADADVSRWRALAQYSRTYSRPQKSVDDYRQRAESTYVYGATRNDGRGK